MSHLITTRTSLPSLPGLCYLCKLTFRFSARNRWHYCPSPSLLSASTPFVVYLCSASHKRQSVLSFLLPFTLTNEMLAGVTQARAWNVRVQWGMLALLPFTHHHYEGFSLGCLLPGSPFPLSPGSTMNVQEAEPPKPIWGNNFLCRWSWIRFVTQWKLTDTASRWKIWLWVGILSASLQPVQGWDNLA